MRVAIQGTHGSFSEAAARRRWPDLVTLPCREARDVVAAVREGRAEAGCLPIENSLIGSVTTTYDLLEEAFGDGTLRLTNEILYPVHHSLMAPPGTTLGDIERVLSHPVALGQCRIWLEKNLPEVELVSAWDTAGSAEIVAKAGSPTMAAIAARHAAEPHGLAILADRIEDDPTNQTRFLTFTRSDAAQLPAGVEGSIRYKTSLIVLIDHKPGMLALTLQAFGVRGVNLMALQSRPERSAPWTYRFYVDIDGSADDPRVAEALEEVERAGRARGRAGELRGLGRRLPPLSAAPDSCPSHPEARHPAGGPPPAAGGDAGSGAARRVRRRGAGAHRRSLLGRERVDDARDRRGGRGRAGADMLRGGAYKPRTSPYDFQGLGVEGPALPGGGAGADRTAGRHRGAELGGGGGRRALRRHAADRRPEHAELHPAPRRQRGAASRSCSSEERARTIEEWLMAAEYILAEGNPNVVLCERGIRTFERATRHTLDLNAVVMVRERTHLPVIVDPSHAAGVRSLVGPAEPRRRWRRGRAG